MAASGVPPPTTISCWCGPRSLSTSLMYAWAQRPDTEVLDEPLYAHYLTHTGLERPYRGAVLDAQPHAGAEVLARMHAPREHPVLFAKHMGKHKVGLDERELLKGRHMILIREPYSVLKSFAEVLHPTLAESCYPALCEIYSALRSLGRPPVVILSEQLAADPEGTLRAVCAAMELPFQEGMLSWAAGPKPYDGPWADWWYAGTHRSTCFEPLSRSRGAALRPELQALLEECRPFYNLLKRHAIKPRSALGDPIAPLPPAGGALAGAKRARGAAEPGHTAAATGATHAYKADERNANILIGIRDGVSMQFEAVWRPEAKVSVLDSGFVLGDGVWEGIRLHRGVLLFAEQHIDRLFEGSKAIDMDLGISKADLEQMIYETCDSNGMQEASHVHIRLMATRGLKSTPYQNPNATIGKPTIVMIPEYKQVTPASKEVGIRLFTCHVRRGPPDVQDAMLNTHSKHNCIQACIQANKAGVDEALMLDPHGFVATCNSVNFFVIRKGELWAPSGRYQLHGITRANAMWLGGQLHMPVHEKDFTLAEVYTADEAFVTGTFAGMIPVREVDGRVIGSGGRGPWTAKLQAAYATLCDAEADRGRSAGRDSDGPPEAAAASGEPRGGYHPQSRRHPLEDTGGNHDVVDSTPPHRGRPHPAHYSPDESTGFDSAREATALSASAFSKAGAGKLGPKAGRNS
eukprot:jgi/Tetstr1/427392/TSEL_017556.t1